MLQDNGTKACLKSKRNLKQMLGNLFFLNFEYEDEPSNYWQNSGLCQKQLAAWPETKWIPQLPFTSFLAQARCVSKAELWPSQWMGGPWVSDSVWTYNLPVLLLLTHCLSLFLTFSPLLSNSHPHQY